MGPMFYPCSSAFIRAKMKFGRLVSLEEGISTMAKRFVLAGLLAAAAAMAQEPRLTPHISNEHPILAIGSAAPDFALPGIDGKIHKLGDYQASRLLMVMFICNHCPTSQLYEGRIKSLVADYSGKGVGFVAIQPNDPKAIELSELGYTVDVVLIARRDEDPRRLPQL